MFLILQIRVSHSTTEVRKNEQLFFLLIDQKSLIWIDYLQVHNMDDFFYFVVQFFITIVFFSFREKVDHVRKGLFRYCDGN